MSNNNRLTIHDLPNEILLMIAKELNIGDVYSLIDIDKRFTQILFDPFYTHNLDMTTITRESCSDYNFSMNSQIFSRIREKIIPKIHDYVYKLTMEQTSIGRILSISYPKLYSLSLVNFQGKILLQYLTGHSHLRDLLTHQITHLNIDIQNETTFALPEILANIFVLILSLTKQSIHLNFCQLFSHRKMWISIHHLYNKTRLSSNITQLKINVKTFFDCLYLLDGGLDSLSKLIISVRQIENGPPHIDNQKKLPKLKYFSLSLDTFEEEYHTIITLLHRMMNLEKLTLWLPIIKINSTYIDGIQLSNDILNRMPRLKKFTFSINTFVIIENIPIHLPTNQDIQNSFIGRGYGQVGSYVFSDSVRDTGRCHVYSLPYQFEYFSGLNNSFHFKDDIFHKVRRLSMIDKRPFEHQFFQLTSHHFPFLKELIICNKQPQKDKQHSSTLIIFPHLIFLDLRESHADYAEQFLFAKNTHLPSLLDLHIEYKSLITLENYFITNPTCFNCTQLRKLHTDKPFIAPNNFEKYFPFL